jgi:hypothetical protein
MIAFAFAVAAVAAAPAPSPAASTPPTIVHTITSRSCTTLSDTIMPIGYVLKKDDEAFGGMSDRLQWIFTNFANQGGSPTRDQLMQLGDSKAVYGSGSRGSPAVDPGDQDTNQFYSPAQTAKAAEVDAIVNAVNGNLGLASQAMDKSLSALPQGSDPKADELRSRAQDLMALQRTFAQNYDTFIKSYVNNANVAWAVNPDQKVFVNAYLVALLNGKGPSDPHALPESEQTRVAAIASTVQNLHDGEQSFAAEVISTYNQCNGTHIDLNATPSPGP